MTADPWATLARDLSSFHNTPEQDAIDALDAARQGDPALLRRFGIRVACPVTLDAVQTAAGRALGDFDRTLR